MAAVYCVEIMNLAILPLAITMLAGPQIMSAIIFVTSTKPVRTSAAFITGVAFAATVGVLITINVASLLDNNLTLGDSADKGSTGHVVQYLLVALLVALAVKNYVRRETVEPPRWLGTLQRADAKRAFSVGFLVILLMPSDVIVPLTVGVNLTQNNAGLLVALPFIVATVLVAALPLLLYLLFYRRAQRLAPKICDWMNAHSWLVNVIACGVFIVLILCKGWAEGLSFRTARHRATPSEGMRDDREYGRQVECQDYCPLRLRGRGYRHPGQPLPHRCARSPRFVQTDHNIYRCRIQIHCSAYEQNDSAYPRLRCE